MKLPEIAITARVDLQEVRRKMDALPSYFKTSMNKEYEDKE